MRKIWLLCAAMIATASPAFSQKNADTVKQAEVLYNGIQLNQQWPPVDGSPVRVPYLQSVPDRIPIRTGRQLFVDDFLIQSTDLVRVFHQAEKFSGNPVFKAETRYELDEKPDGTQSAVTYLGHGGVFYDPVPKEFKMFYS